MKMGWPTIPLRGEEGHEKVTPRALSGSWMCSDYRPSKGEAWQCEGLEGILSGLPGSCVLQQGIEQDTVLL